jgi:hypothetical protein
MEQNSDAPVFIETNQPSGHLRGSSRIDVILHESRQFWEYLEENRVITHRSRCTVRPAFVHDKITLMLLIPMLVCTLTGLALTGLRLSRPQSRVSWWLAMIGALIAWGSVWSWQARLPIRLSQMSWEPLFHGSLRWLADGYSWPYALALTTVMAGVILTSVLYLPANLLAWAGMFLLTAIGLFSVTAENLLTLVLTWAALDIAELMTMLRSIPGERAGEAVTAFAIRLCGLGLVAWAGARTDTLLDFTNVPTEAGLYLFFAAVLRLGVFPLHLPYSQETVLRRDYGSVLRLVSAASSLAVLSRLPLHAMTPASVPLLMLTTLTALYGGYAWLRVSDEMTGRPFWVLGMSGLAMTAVLRGSPVGVTAWGAALILCGGILFLYSARHRLLTGLLLLGAFGLSALPFSATASGWTGAGTLAWPFWILLLLAQACLFGGYLRHASHAGESSIESYPAWAQVIYSLGLTAFPISILALGVGGWPGARMLGIWWAPPAVLLIAIALIWLTEHRRDRRGVLRQWNALPPLPLLYRWLRRLAGLTGKGIALINGLLEGEGGMLWSLLLLALLASLLTAR